MKERPTMPPPFTVIEQPHQRTRFQIVTAAGQLVGPPMGWEEANAILRGLTISPTGPPTNRPTTSRRRPISPTTPQDRPTR